MSVRGWHRYAIAIVVGLVLPELVLTALLEWRFVRRWNVPLAVATDQLLLTRLFVHPWVPQPPALQPYLGGAQRYIGDLRPNSANWADILRPDTLLGVRVAPNVTAMHYGRYVYASNDQGFLSIGPRDFHYDVRPEPSTTRVVVVGGSTVMGQGAPTPDGSLPAAIQRELNRLMPDRRFEVINAGVGGYTSSQELLYTTSELLGYHPSVLIVYDGWNDQTYDNMLLMNPPAPPNALKTGTHFRLDARLAETYTVTGTAGHFLEVAAERVSALARSTALAYAARRLTDRVFASTAAQPAGITYHEASVERYGRTWERFIAAATAADVRIALALQPIMMGEDRGLTVEERSFAPPSDDAAVRRSFYEGARRMIERLRARHTGDAVCPMDLSSVFDEPGPGPVYADSGHLTPTGNTRVAAAMVDRMQACGLLGS